MVLTLYLIPPSSPCRAVYMTAKHLKITFEIKWIDFANGEHKTPEYLKINPQGQVPAIDDNGFNLSESRAIMAYLVNRYSPDHTIYPKDPKQRSLIDKMLYFDATTIYKTFSEFCYPQMFENKPPCPEKEKAFRQVLQQLEEVLCKGKYVAGNNVTIADLSIYAELLHAQTVNFEYTGFPKIYLWMCKLAQELPYHKEINVIPLADFKQYLELSKK